MNVSATKCDFASLKYEQLLQDKYFVQTCFSKNYESYNAHSRLLDMMMNIKFDDLNPCGKFSREIN